MNDRVKQLRLYLNLTQEEFGKRLGVTRSAISYIESGRSSLTDHMLFMICLTFDVNKDWLHDGIGEMFVKHAIGEELARYMGMLMAEKHPEKERYALLLLKLIVDDWELIEKNVSKITDILDWISERPDKSKLF